MRILFVGVVVPEDLVSTENTAISVAGNRMQIQYINALKSSGHQLEIITHIPHTSKKITRLNYFIKSKEINKKSIKYNFVGYVNFPIIKSISLYFKYKN